MDLRFVIMWAHMSLLTWGIWNMASEVTLACRPTIIIIRIQRSMYVKDVNLNEMLLMIGENNLVTFLLS